MKYLSLIALSCFTLMACAAHPAPSMAVEPNVLIMGEDWDEDTIPRKSQIFERVIDAVAGQLNKAGFKVIDETMACLLYTSPSPRDGLLSRMPSSA